ncbi:MAG: HEAT repeat domain-containing protein [Planctomycetes bacterium]|nr:HEAT repeat domain-containing protein [Planctomycetota bacterium]
MNENRTAAAVVKFDVADSTRLSPECMPQARDAVEAAFTGYGVETGFPRWEGDGGSAYFRGPDAAVRAARAALDATERVRLISGYEVRLRASVGVGEAPEGADLTRVTAPDFNLAGHMAGSDVCAPSAVCLTEDVYLFLLGASAELAGKFSYLGTTVRDGAPVFVGPTKKQPEKPGGLKPAASDPYAAALCLRAYYTRPPFSNLRFYALPQFNFVGELDLASVYTPVSVRRHRPAALSRLPAHGEEADLLREPDRAPPEAFVDAFGRHRSLVVLGNPGSGKTTLLRYLAVVTAAGRHATRERLGAGERLLPLYAPAASFLQALRDHPSEEPPRAFARLLGPRAGADVDLLTLAIAEKAAAGEVLFLVDGLDEMALAADRDEAARRIEELAGRFDKSRFVATSRLAGYPGLGLRGGEEYVLEPLAAEEARSLARAFYVEFFRSQKYEDAAARREGTAKGDRLAGALAERESLSLFASNPLLLSLAALVHVQLGELPRYRVKLYDVAAETLVSAWARARHAVANAGSVPAVDYDTEGRAVLPALALHIHESCPGGVIPEGELLRLIEKSLPGRRGAGASGTDDARAKNFLGRLAVAGSLLVERAPGEWAFSHQTFQEYLAAKHLAAQDRQDELLSERLYEPRWEEVVKFVAGEMGVVQGRSPATAKFIRGVLEDKTDWRATDLRRNVLLAAECYADTACQDRELEDELPRALEDVFSRGYAPRSAVKKSLRALRGTSVAERLVTSVTGQSGSPTGGSLWALAELGRSDLAIPALVEILREAPDSGSRESAASTLGDLGAREAIPDLLRALREDKDGWVRANAARALGALGAREAIPDLLRTLREDKHAWARADAASTLGDPGAREAIPELLQTLRADEDRWVRIRAALALRVLGARDGIAEFLGTVIPELLRTLREDKRAVARADAAFALVALGAREAIPDLLRTLREDKDDWVRGSAARALGALGAREATADLLRTFREHGDGWARAGAARALGHLGAREAIPDLLHALREDGNDSVRRIAALALWRIADRGSGA